MASFVTLVETAIRLPLDFSVNQPLNVWPSRTGSGSASTAVAMGSSYFTVSSGTSTVPPLASSLTWMSFFSNTANGI